MKDQAIGRKIHDFHRKPRPRPPRITVLLQVIALPQRPAPLYLIKILKDHDMSDESPVEGTPLIAPSSTDHPLYDNIVDSIRTVYDPEIPVNIFDLGLIYTVDINEDSEVKIAMTLTAPGCPVAGEMPGWVAEAVEPLPGVKHVDVELVWEPPWGMDMMSDEARLELGFM
jgi:FeS assembly SUF system protein